MLLYGVSYTIIGPKMPFRYKLKNAWLPTLKRDRDKLLLDLDVHLSLTW